MPATIDELALDRQLVERHVAESFSQSFDDTLNRSHYKLLSRTNSMPVVRRLSSDLGSSRLSSFGFIPGHEVIETSVRFLGVTRVHNHCAFKLHVDTGREQFELQKRYSQFRDLRQQLLLDRKVATTGEKHKDDCRNGACTQLVHQLATLKFPRRKMKFKMHRDDDIKTARERQAQLQHFVDMILAVYRTAPKRQVRCCVNSHCKVLEAVRSFLDIHDLGEELSDWKATSNGTTSGDEVPILDTPPSTSSNPSPLGKTASGAGSDESPLQTRTSVMYLEELYTITED
ncbi:hypothetical protein PHMEG_000812 [Phytophthora megakarya]|uniref:PX domain-containing protein n=1 Tax=Phytophthora megakarya TaxID=4795 RepID=A0A225X4N2_9STRA|nr:hypothetical protein PHMEG_000812 [Phytophthora megakarya]